MVLIYPTACTMLPVQIQLWLTDPFIPSLVPSRPPLQSSILQSTGQTCMYTHVHKMVFQMKLRIRNVAVKPEREREREGTKQSQRDFTIPSLIQDQQHPARQTMEAANAACFAIDRSKQNQKNEQLEPELCLAFGACVKLLFVLPKRIVSSVFTLCVHRKISVNQLQRCGNQVSFRLKQKYFEAEKKSYKFAQVGNSIYGSLFQSLFQFGIFYDFLSANDN